LIEANQTDFIEDAGIAICIEFKLFDEDLCIAGMREYQVKRVVFILILYLLIF
jgi:hypothetical protein